MTLLQPGQHAVLQLDPHTGFHLAEDGTPAKGEGFRRFRRVFDSLDAAEGFCAQQLVERPDTEWWILDHQGVRVRFVRDFEYWQSWRPPARVGWFERLRRRVSGRDRG